MTSCEMPWSGRSLWSSILINSESLAINSRESLLPTVQHDCDSRWNNGATAPLKKESLLT